MLTLKFNANRLMALFSIVILLNSCMTTKTQIGDYKEKEGKEYTYAKGKQMWLFWGLIPIGRTSVNTPSDKTCEVVTKYTFLDVLITGLTGGIVCSYTIKVNAKKAENN